MYIFLFALLSFMSLSAKETIYSHIQQCNLNTLEWQEEEWPNEPYRSFLHRSFRYQKHPQEAKKRRIVFRMFHGLAQNDDIPHSALYDLVTAQDIGLLCGQKKDDPYIAQIIDRTKTECGRVYFYGMLSHPLCDIPLLQARQAVIKKMAGDKDLMASLTACYTTLAAQENMVLAFWAQDSFLQATKRHYYSIPYFTSINAKLNCSPTALSMKAVWGHGLRGLSLGITATAAVILPIYAITNTAGYSFLPDFMKRWAAHQHGITGPVGRFLTLITQDQNSLLTAGLKIAGGFYAGLACKKEYQWLADNVTLDACLQQKMTMFMEFLVTAEHLSKECSGELATIFPAAQRLSSFFAETVPHDKDLSTLLAMAHRGMEQGDKSFFEHTGTTLVAYHLAYLCKEKLEPLLLLLGEIDAYRSIAELYEEFQDKSVHFCFPTYVENKDPQLSMHGFWNPFIDPNKVVPNSLSLNGPERRNMVITGPNAGGKSTIIKSIALNLILTQSICLAAADELMCTPFYAIGTYLNVVDNIAAGNSLFKAQVLRAQQMVELVEKTPHDKKCFIALDEMFNGASPDESRVTAYSVAHHIGKFDNALCALATHFSLLTTLAHNTTTFENYKVSVTVTPTDIVYPFVLEKGISDQHVALDIIRQEGYACSIVDTARSLLDYHKNNA